MTCGGLLSVPASAANAHEALQHSQYWPDAIAEEMEGFAVGLASRLYAMPLTIIRGLSNVAGDSRNPLAVEDLLWMVFMLPEFQIIR